MKTLRKSSQRRKFEIQILLWFLAIDPFLLLTYQLHLTMIIFKCRFSGDEMCSDAFGPAPVQDEDGAEIEGLFKIESQKVNKVR